MPAIRDAVVFLRLLVGEQERELESFCQADELELGGGRQSLGVPAVEGSAETHVGRALSGHERMFAYPVPDACWRPSRRVHPPHKRRKGVSMYIGLGTLLLILLIVLLIAFVF